MLILINGNIHTMDSDNLTADSIVIEDNKIIFVGKYEDALKYSNQHCEVIDLQGKTAVPGFNDGHLHFMSVGSSIGLKLDLLKYKTKAEVIEAIKKFIEDKKIPNGAWVQCRGLNTSEEITTLDLDGISRKHYIVLTYSYEEGMLINSEVFNFADMECRNGALKDRADTNRILKCIPEYTVEELKYMVKSAAQYALSRGLTSCSTDDFPMVAGENYNKIIEAYKQLDEENNLNIRIYQQCRFDNYSLVMDFLDASYNTGQGNEHFKIGPIKIITDGGLTGRTALLSEPYEDDKTKFGISRFNQEEINNIVDKANKKGMQVAIHCIGDKSMDMVLNSYEDVLPANQCEKYRYSIIHTQLTNDNIIRRMKDSEIIAHVQPIFINYDMHLAEKRLGQKRAFDAYVWKTMMDNNIMVTFGTDSPVEDLNPLANIYAAVTRKDLKGYPDGGWNPSQKVTVEQSVQSYTANTAYATFEENIKGKIKKGLLADIVVLDEDIFTIEPDKIKDMQVYMTIFDGKVVYKK